MHKIHKHLSEGAATLAALSATLISQDPDGQVHINVDALTKRFGEKFVQHIGHVGSLLDVLDALAKYFGEQSMQLLLQLVRKFLEEYLDGIERSLNTFLSTESVLYRILMQCINNYENFTFEFLVEHRDEILTIVSKYFEAMQPIDAQSSRRIKCDDCQGVYYTCDI